METIVHPSGLPAPFTLQVRHLWDGSPISPADEIELFIEPGDETWLLRVRAPFYNDPPPRGPVGATWGLWEHEVVEWFIAGPGEDYLEIELSPHGHHLALRLNGVRQVVQRELPLSYWASRDGRRWSGEAHIPVAWLPAGPWRVNAYGIHGLGESRTYLAAYPMGGSEPDFHRLESFRDLPLDT